MRGRDTRPGMLGGEDGCDDRISIEVVEIYATESHKRVDRCEEDAIETGDCDGARFRHCRDIG